MYKFWIKHKWNTFVNPYRSSSQSQDNSETFINKVELNLETLTQKNSYLVVVIGGFNAKSKICYCNENTTSQGKALEDVTSQLGFIKL